MKTENMQNPRRQVFLPIAENVRYIGRNFYSADSQTLWCALSGTGIAFRFCGTYCAVTLAGDSAVPCHADSAARYAVYCNGELVQSGLLNQAEMTLTLLQSDVPQETEVRIVKLSEAANSCIGIRNLLVAAENGIAPVPAKRHLIEFIGDSITCGYGVDAAAGTEGFQTASEDVTKAYAYLTAAALAADYSMVSYSGYGVFSGYTADGKQNTDALVSPYYDKVGFSYSSIEQGKYVQQIPWEFVPQPDLIVVNLGTNDASYTGDDAAKQADFIEAYVRFLKAIRKRNPNAAILCCLGTMSTILCGSMETAAARYQAETGDTQVYTMRFALQSAADGYGADWHPSAVTHRKAAEQLAALIREKFHWNEAK